MPSISQEEDNFQNANYEYDITPIDNDEEEETRILSYAEKEEMEKTKVLNNESLESIIDRELDSSLSDDDCSDENEN